MEKVLVPTLGESVTEATVVTWLKKQGEAVAVDELLCELETDKITVEVPAPVAGILAEIVAAEGAIVAPDGLLAQIDRSSSAPAPAKVKQKASTPVAAPATVVQPQVAAPAPPPNPVRPQKPQPAMSTRGPVSAEDAAREERVQMTKMRQTIARRLKDAQNTAAMLTTYNEVDMSNVMETRTAYKDAFHAKHGVKLGFMSFFVKACCEALHDFPDLNAEIQGADIIYKNYVNMAVAVGTAKGLMVPVLRDAHRMSLAEIENSILKLGERARDGKLTVSEMEGGSFTISNGGVFGSLISSPILNPPQSGIFGMHKIQERPVAVDGSVQVRPMMYTALSYDHRIVDGKGAVSFLVRVKDLIEEPARLLLMV